MSRVRWILPVVDEIQSHSKAVIERGSLDFLLQNQDLGLILASWLKPRSRIE